MRLFNHSITAEAVSNQQSAEIEKPIETLDERIKRSGRVAFWNRVLAADFSLLAAGNGFITYNALEKGALQDNPPVAEVLTVSGNIIGTIAAVGIALHGISRARIAENVTANLETQRHMQELQSAPSPLPPQA